MKYTTKSTCSGSHFADRLTLACRCAFWGWIHFVYCWGGYYFVLGVWKRPSCLVCCSKFCVVVRLVVYCGSLVCKYMHSMRLKFYSVK